MRCIDADTLMNTFADRLAKVSERYGVNSAVAGAVAGAMGLIEAQPTIEPERKTGHWLDIPDGYKCSECGAYLEIDCGDVEMNFCPNCGAKMDGGEEE